MLFRAILVGSLCSLAVGQTFDLGDVEQYKGDADISTLNGGSVLLTRGDSDGLRIELGTDTQAKVKSAIDSGCADDNNQCYQGVYNVLNDADLELDSQFDKRDLSTLVSRSAGLILAVVFAVVGIIIEYHRLHSTEGPLSVVNLPLPKASEASVFGSHQPVTISAQGSAVVTVTPTPDPTSLQGQTQPTVISITQAVAGYQPGDFMAKLDPDLAARIDEVMHRTSNCQDGRDFDSSHPAAARKRAPGTLGNAICGAQAVAGMAQPGGPFNDILLINGPALNFRAADYAAAAQQVVGFVRDWAPLLALDPATATEVGQTLFILAIDTLINGVPLAAENPIKQDLVEEGQPGEDPSTTTTTDCPRPTECVVNCDGVGDKFYFCETDCVTKTTECAPNTSQTMTVTTTATHEWDAYPTASSESGESLQAQDPKCDDVLNRSNLPVKVFYDVNSDQNVVGQFCDRVGQNQGSVAVNVDVHGNIMSPKMRRTPPANPDTYIDYKIHLTWDPTEGVNMASCPKSCKDVWYGIAQGICGSASGTATTMTNQGSQDIGCGTYGWTIISPSQPSQPSGPVSPLEVGTVQCKPSADGHSDSIPADVSMGSKILCGNLPEDFGPNTAMWQQDINGFMQGHPMTFTVEWEKGCTTTVASQNAKWPVGDHDAPQLVCYQLFLNDWQNCNNGGAGGSTKAGCLVYTYYPR